MDGLVLLFRNAGPRSGIRTTRHFSSSALEIAVQYSGGCGPPPERSAQVMKEEAYASGSVEDTKSIYSGR
jgi:hypothetical protein